MSRNCRLAVASPAHIGRLANNLREIDRIECAAFGRSPKEALRFSLRTSLYALTAIDEATGQPLAMMGVSPVDMMQGKGTPWFLGSDDVFNFARDLIVTGPCMIDWWLGIFRTLDNVVALDNTRAIRLLAKWGATFDGEHQMINGIEFVPFSFTRKRGDTAASPLYS